jgi:hypothetical protein
MGGESIFRKAPDIGLASCSIIPLRAAHTTQAVMPERQEDKREESKVVFDLFFHLKVNQGSVER